MNSWNEQQEQQKQPMTVMGDVDQSGGPLKDLEAATPSHMTGLNDNRIQDYKTSKPESFRSEPCTVDVHSDHEKDENQDDAGQRINPKKKKTTTTKEKRKRFWVISLTSMMIVLIIIAVSVPLCISKSSDKYDTTSQQPDLPEPLPEFNTLEGQEMMDLVHTFLPRRAFNDSMTTQSKALDWILYDDTFFRDSFTLDSLYITIDDRKLRRYALAAIWFAGGDEAEEDDDYSNSTWFRPIDECEWTSTRVSVDCVPGSPDHFNLEIGDTFTGTLPAELGLLTGMNIFSYDTQIVGIKGKIPTEIGLLQHTDNFMMFRHGDDDDDHVSGNDTNTFGPLPSEIGQMTSLVNLMIDGMQLEGSLPTEIGRLTQMQTLAIRSNEQLNGPIPTEIGLMTSLIWLFLDRNNITGPIPKEVGNLSSLKILRIEQNGGISGSIPPELGFLESLVELKCHNNEITGELPTELGHLKNLKTLDLHENVIYGSIPQEWERGFDSLSYLDMSNNMLGGLISPAFASFSKLSYLDLSHNDHTGSIPSDVGLLTHLETLILDSNALTSTIPQELENIENLKIFSIRNNDIVGTVPEGLCTFPTRGGGDDMKMNAFIIIDCGKVDCPAAAAAAEVDDCFCLSGDNDFPTRSPWDYLDLVDWYHNNDDILTCPAL